MESLIETLLLNTRWMLLPLYLALLACVLVIYVLAGRELLHLVSILGEGDPSEILLVVLSILDLALVANLLVMVGVSSYESFISRIAVAEGENKPEWLGKLDSGNVKVKVALSIVLISAIQLLRYFMVDSPLDRIRTMALVHVVFLFSTLTVALVDRLSRDTR